MKISHSVLLICLAGGLAIAQEKTLPSQQVIAIRAGPLIDVKSDRPRRDQLIVIRGNRIESVSDAASVKIPSGASVIDLSHATVLPGLIDSHTHIFLQKALKAGVKIIFGADMGGIPWTEPMAQELSRMVEFGMAPMDAIKSATSRPAEMLDMQGQIGVLAPGAYADIIAVIGDPVQDMRILDNVQFVMKDGKVFKNEVK